MPEDTIQPINTTTSAELATSNSSSRIKRGSQRNAANHEAGLGTNGSPREIDKLQNPLKKRPARKASGNLTVTDVRRRRPVDRKRKASNRLFEFGGYYIKERAENENYCRYWQVAGERDVRRETLGTKDIEEAKALLVSIVLQLGQDPDSLSGDPPMATVLAHYFADPKNTNKWVKVRKYLKDELAILDATLTISNLTPGLQKRLINQVKDKWAPNTIKGIMKLLSAICKHACKSDDDGRVLSRHNPRIISSVKDICEILKVRRPKADDWCPELEGMVEVLKQICHHEGARRWALLALYTGGRPSALAQASIEQFTTARGITIFDLLQETEVETNKRRGLIPVANVVMDEILSWGDGPWICTIDTVATKLQKAREVLDMPQLKPSCFRDFAVTTLRYAHIWFEVEEVTQHDHEVWVGHRVGSETNSKYGLHHPKYLRTAIPAMEACIVYLNEQSGGALLRRVSAGRPATQTPASIAFQANVDHLDSVHRSAETIVGKVADDDKKTLLMSDLAHGCYRSSIPPDLGPTALEEANGGALQVPEQGAYSNEMRPVAHLREEHGRDSFPREEEDLNVGSGVKTGLDGAILAFFRRVTDDPIDKIFLYENAFALTEADQIGEIRAIGIMEGRSGCSAELFCYLQENREYTIFDSPTKSIIEGVRLIDFTNTYCIKDIKLAVRTHGAYSEKSCDIDDDAILELGYKLRKQTLASRSLENKLLETIQQIEMTYFKKYLQGFCHPIF